jgi:hypothetical protein
LDLYQTSNYFIAYLNLLADVCYGKNTEAKKYVDEKMKPINKGSIMRRSINENNENLDSQLNSFTSLDTLIGILQDK